MTKEEKALNVETAATEVKAVRKTKLELFGIVANYLKDNSAEEELIEFIEKEVSLLENRQTKNKGKKTKLQIENEETAEKIAEWMFSEGDPEVAYTGSELSEAVGLDVTPQKMTALVSVLEKDGKVVKVPQATNSKVHVGYKVV